MTSHLLVLGFTIGLISIVPPGPVTMTLIEVGSAQGRRRGAEGGLGVVAGEAVAAVAAALLVVAGAGLPTELFATLQVISSLVLLGIGVALIARPAALHTLALGITNPTRALFMLTALTPTVLGAWVAIIAALPFADDGRSVALFLLGALIASLIWHLFIGSAAGDVGHRVAPTTMQVLSRVGGGALVVFGLVTLAGSVPSIPVLT